MRDLIKNTSEFYYSINIEETQLQDDENNLTGEVVKVYGKPIKAFARITPNTGKSTIEAFGINLKYDKIISTTKDLHINEYSKLYIDVKPFNGNEPNYRVVGISKDLNQHLYAIEMIGGANGKKNKCSLV